MNARPPYLLGGVEVPSVTQILRLAGLDPFAHVRADILEAACLRGTLVHYLTQLYDEDDLHWPDVRPEHAGYLESWIRWREHTGFVPSYAERRVYNDRYRYGGTPDRRGLLNGRDAIVDLKSGPIQPCVALQLAGYVLAESPAGALRRVAVRVMKDGSMARVQEFDDRGDFAVFLSLVGAAHWRLRFGEKLPASAEAAGSLAELEAELGL